MTRQKFFLLILAILLIVFSWMGVICARVGLVVRSLEYHDVPMLYFAPVDAEKVPGILVAHGFGVSKQVMLGYAYTLAHSGYAVILWDFDGHGANAAPFLHRAFQKNLDIAYKALIEQPEVNPERLALLGHSMGSGVVMSAGIRDVDRFAATVAIAPTGADVNPSAPKNLLLQAGSWDGRSIKNAQHLIKVAGGERGKFNEGKGRSLVIIPNAEHSTILFNPASYQATLKWLNTTFDMFPNHHYVDLRMLWYSLHLIGCLILFRAVTSILVPSISAPRRVSLRPSRGWSGLFLAPLVAVNALNWLSHRVEIHSLGRLIVGDAISLWFLIAGLTWLGFLSYLPRPTCRAVGQGVTLFLLLWVAFGLMAQFLWLQWWLTLTRLQLFPIISLIMLPWFLASGIVQQGCSIGRRFVWWLGQTIALVGGFILVLFLIPQLGFVFFLLPLFPPIMIMLSFIATLFEDIWSYALASALFFGWMVAASFPLAS